MPVALVDDRPEEIGRQPGRAAVSVVDPDLDQVHLPGGQFANRLPRLVFSRHFIGNPGVGRTTRSRVRRADAAAGDEQTRAAQLSCFLVGTNLEGDVALFDALRLDDRDSVIQRPVEIVDDVFAREVIGAVGEASLEAGMPVRVDQGGHDRFAGEVDAARADGRDHIALPADGRDRAALDEKRRIDQGRAAVAGDEPGTLVQDDGRGAVGRDLHRWI